MKLPKSLLLIVLVALGLTGGVFFLRKGASVQEVEISSDGRVEIDERMANVNAEISRSLRFDQRSAKLVNNPLDRAKLSDMALVLDDPEVSEKASREAVYGLLSSLQVIANRGDYPAGLNVEITNALLGDNPRKVGYLPMDSPRINKNGELVDTYGTPYWFHSKTSKDLTITSAGPDRLMHTADDVAFPSD